MYLLSEFEYLKIYVALEKFSMALPGPLIFWPDPAWPGTVQLTETNSTGCGKKVIRCRILPIFKQPLFLMKLCNFILCSYHIQLPNIV